MTERTPELYLQDIRKSIESIEKYTAGISNWQEFKENEMAFDAVVRNFEVIGEAVRNIVLKCKIDEDKMPWLKIIGLRNRIAHEYFGIDAGTIWKTVEEDLPYLKESVKMLEEDIL